MPLTEVLEWRYKAIQRSGANDVDNNLRLQVILNVHKLTRSFSICAGQFKRTGCWRMRTRDAMLSLIRPELGLTASESCRQKIRN